MNSPRNIIQIPNTSDPLSRSNHINMRSSLGIVNKKYKQAQYLNITKLFKLSLVLVEIRLHPSTLLESTPVGDRRIKTNSIWRWQLVSITITGNMITVIGGMSNDLRVIMICNRDEQ